MARTRHSRSPSPTGSRKDERGRADGTRDGQRRFRDRDRDRDRGRNRNRDYRDRDRDRERERPQGRTWDNDYDNSRRRDRSLDRRDDGWRGNDYRRRSRSRSQGRRNRSRDDRNYREKRPENSNDRARSSRDGTAATTSRPASGNDPTPARPSEKTEAEKKADRLAKLEAWKKKHEQKQRIENGSASNMQQDKAPSVVAPLELAAAATPAYFGKFDPKAIAKKSTRHHSPDFQIPPVMGQTAVQATAQLAFKGASKSQKQVSAAKPFSGFGFNKGAAAPSSSKRKLDLDDEETSKRKLAKLPDVFDDVDDTLYTNQEDDGDSDDGGFDGTEEEFAAAMRAAKERREQRLSQQTSAMQTDDSQTFLEAPASNPAPTAQPAELAEPTKNSKAASAPISDAMDVDPKPPTTHQNGNIDTQPAIKMITRIDANIDTNMDDEDGDVDPLDAFMADLASKPVPSAKLRSKMSQGEAVTYFSDDEDYFTKAQDGVDASSILAMAAKRKKKDIPKIDYSKLDLAPIRKDFWVEPHELSELTEAEVAELRLDLDGIKVSGKDVPKPVQKWSHCGLTRPILDVIDRLGYEKPTPIQMQAVPVIMSGRDVIGVAKTGSGKTMAYLVPMFRHIMDQDLVKGNEGPVGLILTPTRELAVQIHKDCKPFAKTLGLRTVCAYGGPPIKDQIAELKRGAEIIVATTGRMIDLLAANQGRVVNLKRTTYIVLDEADRMFDMGFEPQVMKIFANVRPDRQTLLFSATMPRIIDALVKKVLQNPVEITVGGRSVVAPEITQIVEIREEKDKFIRLLELLGELYINDDDVRALIFVERQEKADDLLRELLRKGYACMSLHGGKDQIDRDSTISDFKNGVCPVLVATSVAARGLDVKQLKLVVNYDAPNHLEDYVHRAGRTGRAGNTGTAVTFVTEEQENCAPGIAKALEQSGQPVPERLIEMRKAWREKVKAGKAKDQSGFGGKGLEKLDKDREAARQRERKTHRQEGEEEEFDKETAAEDDKKKKKADTLAQSAASAIISRDTSKPESGDGKPASGAKAGGALEKAASAISDINARLARAGQLRPGQPIDNKGPDAGAFHATLEINDFPQKARWAVTNRTNVAKILDSTATSITTKGTFYAAGKEPQAGQEPKLYLLIEGDTEVAVGNALTELTRLLREGTMAAADAENRAPAAGRYTIT